MSAAQAWAEAAFLGLVQGLTEFLPVSSSAHLRIIGPLLPSGGDPGAAFTAITQIGTEAAVLLYFRHDILRIAKAWMASLADRGRRLDHIWVSRALKDGVSDFRITRDARGWERPSDHVPVTVTLSARVRGCGRQTPF